MIPYAFVLPRPWRPRVHVARRVSHAACSRRPSRCGSRAAPCLARCAMPCSRVRGPPATACCASITTHARKRFRMAWSLCDSLVSFGVLHVAAHASHALTRAPAGNFPTATRARASSRSYDTTQCDTAARAIALASCVAKCTPEARPIGGGVRHHATRRRMLSDAVALFPFSDGQPLRRCWE